MRGDQCISREKKREKSKVREEQGERKKFHLIEPKSAKLVHRGGLGSGKSGWDGWIRK